MGTRRYGFILVRVEYPSEGGYRMKPQQLPDWIHIAVTDKGDSKFLTVHSRIHVNKEAKVGPSYSSEFSDRDIIKDLSGKISRMYL